MDEPSEPKQMRASIQKVAELAQVSPMTVTRVLRGRDVVAAETRERVLAAVRATNYVPISRPAFQNRHVATNILGLVPYNSEVLRNRIDSETYEGVCRAARRCGYDVLVMLRDEAEWMADRAEMRFLDRRSDGFVFVSTGSGEWRDVLDLLSDHRMPVVVCYRRDVPENVGWIDPDNEAILRETLGLMYAAGHEKVAYLTTRAFQRGEPGHMAQIPASGGNFDDAMRREVYERRAAEAGRTPIIAESGRGDWGFDTEVLRSLLGRGVTGIICVNDLLALEVWKAAEALGLRIPGDLSLTGVDNSVEAEARGLTSIGFGYDTVGEMAVEAWVALAQKLPVEQCRRVVPITLYHRRSVAPPPPDARRSGT